MARPLEELREIRRQKLEQLLRQGQNPYPSFWGPLKKRILAAECRKLEVETGEVVVAGRLRSWREHGGLIFAHLEDQSGSIQLVFKRDQCDFAALKFFDRGDFIGVKGPLFYTKKGELSVLVKDFSLLSKSLRPLPSQWYGLQDKEIRYRQRYLDLILNPEVKKIFLLRTQIIRQLRFFLDQHGFLEVETPVLQPLYGGASARPFVTHHNALDIDLYLRISDELYLKRLIVAGWEKVYEIGHNFRNEGIDRQHNPEFTMLEFYWAYSTYEDLMTFTEEMISFVLKKILRKLKIEYQGLTLDFTPPWPRLSFYQLLEEKTGINLHQIQDEDQLKREIEKKGLKVKEEGIAGYGALVDRLYKEYCRPQIVQPTFLLDYPTAMLPLAKRKDDNPAQIASFQLLAAGFEVIKAYNELNDPLDQRRRWEEMEQLAARGLEEHEVLDEDYLRALEYGMPPTAGWGMGIDRFVALVTNQPHLKEVILFPTLRPEFTAKKESD